MEQGWPGLAQYIPAVPADWSPRPRTVQDALDQLGGRAGGAGVASAFVFRPGGVAAPGVYTTSASLLAAVDTLDTAADKTIAVDDSIAAAHISGGPWPDNITWETGKNAVSATLIVDDGCTWAGLTYRFRSITLAPNNTAPVVTVAGGALVRLLFEQAVMVPTGAAHVFADVSGTILLNGIESTFGDGTAGHEMFSVEASGSVLCVCLAATTLKANVFKQGAAPGGFVGIEFDAESQAVVSMTQVPAPLPVNFDPQPTFVFQPGGTTNGNVFTTWASLMAAAALSPGPKWILVDDTLGAAHMTAGAWNLNRVTLLGGKPTGSATLHVDTGVTIVGTKSWAIGDFLTVIGEAVGASVWTPSATGSLLYLLGGSTSVLQGSAGATAFMHVTAAGNFSGIIALGGANVGDFPGTWNVITTDVGQTGLITLGGGSGTPAVLRPHAAAGAGTTAVGMSDTAIFNTQVDVTGTVTQSFNSLSSLVAYTPGTAGNWQPAPTLVNAALDQLSAPNFTQAANNTGTGTGTITITTGNISKLRSGKMVVTANIAGESTGPGTITLQLIRDAATNIGNPIAVTALSANDDFSLSMTFVDTAPDAAAHTYKFTATASAGNITCAATSGQLSVFEL